METSNKNLALYEELRSVPNEAQKSFNNGRFSGTDINPMWRIKKLTETFGPAGIGWYTEVVKRDIVSASDGTKCAFVGLNLYVKIEGEWSKPIYGEGGNTFETKTKSGNLVVSDEAFKMAYTDALSICAKALGLGADVWFGNDKQHGTKYDVQQENFLANTKEKSANPGTATPAKQTTVTLDGLLEKITFCKTSEEVAKIWNDNKDFQKEPRFVTAIKEFGTKLKQQEGKEAA